MRRREFLGTAAISLGGTLAAAALPSMKEPAAVGTFELDELPLADLASGQKAGRYTAEGLTKSYLGRIAEIDSSGPGIHSVIETNPEALGIAAQLDRERAAGHVRGPLHGIPILIKDNIDTADQMQTTAGSLALLGSKPARDSAVAARLRAAGAVILGKTNLSEWANIRSSHATSGWSGRGGQTHNPYALDRNPCGSSSGSGAATSASLCAAAIGTETDGSIVCPSSSNGIVGLKPTVGLVSRAGIIPISHSQDTAGPMGRSVRDVAMLLGAISERAVDYTESLDASGLKGARLGVAHKFFGISDASDYVMQQALEALRGLGALLVDPADLPSQGKFDQSEALVLSYELKADMNAYLAQRPGAPANLAALIEFNEKNRPREMPYFGQDLFIAAEQRGPLSSLEYQKALANDQNQSRAEGIDLVMDQHHLDALIAPTAGPAWLTDYATGDHDTGGSSTPAAVAGYPALTVPAGFVYGLPVGITFFGRAWSEPTLLKLGYSFEQATRHRRQPRFLATMPGAQ
ncbi:MAG TPA: amidase [Terriglobales bacterium]|nr:amidase [Terriglobales bacterium]